MASVVDVLKLAARMIERSCCWTKNAFARDVAGHVVLTEDKSARMFSLCGAVERANSELRGQGASLYPVAVNALRLELLMQGKISDKMHVDEWADLPAVVHSDVMRLLAETAKRVSESRAA